MPTHYKISKVLDWRIIKNRTGHQAQLTLACGHTITRYIRRYGSRQVTKTPKKVRCIHCSALLYDQEAI